MRVDLEFPFYRVVIEHAEGPFDLLRGMIRDGGARGFQEGGVIVYPADGSCGDESVLWRAIESAAGATLGYCEPPGDGGVEEGHVAIDSDERVIDNSLFGCDRDGGCDVNGLTDWLASLAAYRWPCLAGRTISYTCVAM